MGKKCDDGTMWFLESHIFKRRKCVVFGQLCDRVRFEDKPLKTRRYVVYGILCDNEQTLKYHHLICLCREKCNNIL